MQRDILIACAPWLGLLAAAFVAARALIRWSGARWQWGRLKQLHACQAGSVQSLSFVLTLPLFLLIVLFIVQVSQLMIAITVVHYAAYAAARSAMVWIPAATPTEFANQVIYAPTYNGTAWEVDQIKAGARFTPPGEGTDKPLMSDQSKYAKIWWSAVIACAPISPSRDLGIGGGSQLASSVRLLYGDVAPSTMNNTRTAPRLENKLAYSTLATMVWINGMDKDNFRGPTYNPRPGYYTQGRNPDTGEIEWIWHPWNPNEIGWEDPMRLTVTHDFALLPGPARLLATMINNPTGAPDLTAQRIQVLPAGLRENVYTTTLVASATLSNEGFKSVLPYVQRMD